jgi:hypothetical protein
MDKLEIARRQLGMALHLYIENLDPVSVHSLAGNSREILDTLSERNNTESFFDHASAANPSLTKMDYYAAANLYRNAFKHCDRKDESVTGQFDDQANAHLLFICWFTYANLCGKLPVEAQIFQVWYFNVESHRTSNTNIVELSVELFGDLKAVDQSERKSRLQKIVADYLGDEELANDPRTETCPLIHRNI